MWVYSSGSEINKNLQKAVLSTTAILSECQQTVNLDYSDRFFSRQEPNYLNRDE